MKILKWFFITILVFLLIGSILILNLLKVRELNEQITLIQPRIASLGANIVIYQDSKQRIIVDSQLSVLAILAGWHIGTLNAEDNIIVTHWHPDHSGGFSRIRGDATVFAHENTVARLSTAQTGYDLTAPGSIHKFKARPPEHLPNQTVTKALVLGGVEIMHFANAHTDGDLSVFFPKADVIAVGDLVWPQAFPFLDIHTGGSASGLLTALDAIIARGSPTTLIIPGHGDPMSMAALQNYRKMVADSTKVIACADKQTAAGTVLTDWQTWGSALVPVQTWYNMAAADRSMTCGKKNINALSPGV